MDVDCEVSEQILMVLHTRTGVAVAAVLHSIDLLETVTNFFPRGLETLCAVAWRGRPGRQQQTWQQD